MPVTREELHALVWSKPMTHAARQFGVSDSYLSRICTLLNVPRPERGYWAKLAVGKAPAVTPLPTAKPGDPTQWDKDSALELPPPSRPQMPPSTAPGRSKRRSNESAPRPTTHPLIAGTRKHFEHTRPSDDSYGNAPVHLRPYKKLLVDINSSQPTLERSLSTANDLFNLLDTNGFRVVIAHSSEHFRRPEIDNREIEDKNQRSRYYTPWKPAQPTVAYIRDMAIGLTLVEMTEFRLMRCLGSGKYIPDSEYKPPKLPRNYADGSWTTTMEKPTGRLRLVAYSPYQLLTWSHSWQEAGGAELGQRLPSIVKELARIAEDLRPRLASAREENERRRNQLLIEIEQHDRARDKSRVAEARNASRKQLDSVIDAWAKANATDHFFNDLRSRAQNLPEPMRTVVSERINRALAIVGDRDALAAFDAWEAPEERYTSKYGIAGSDEED